MKARLLILLTLILLYLEINHEEPQRSQPRYIKPNINRMLENPSIKEYMADSIQQYPFNPPQILIQLEPLYPGLLGITYKLKPNLYLIGLNPLYSHLTLERTLFHELVHVKQLVNRDLDGNLWKGQLQDWTLPWSSRPWEQQAEAETRLFYKP